MKFFVPSVGSINKDKAYNAIKNTCQESTSTPILNEKIYSVDFEKEGNSYTATVGEILEFNSEKVFAIFSTESTLLIATLKAGVKEGQPIQISKSDTKHTVAFDIH